MLRHWVLLVASALLGLGGGWLVQQSSFGGSGGAAKEAPAADVDAAPGTDDIDQTLAGIAGSDGGGTAGNNARDLLGEPRPDFALPDLDGEPVPVSRFDGDLLVINFWATWCPPCVEEIPMLVDLQDDLADDGVQVFGVAVEPPEPVRDFAAEFGIQYPLVADRREGFAVAEAYGNPNGLMPYTVFVDREGIIRGVHQGLLSREQAEQHLGAMRAESE
jgi:peroxiredoxin